MNKNLHTNHHSIVIDTPELASSLEDAMIARDNLSSSKHKLGIRNRRNYNCSKKSEGKYGICPNRRTKKVK